MSHRVYVMFWMMRNVSFAISYHNRRVEHKVTASYNAIVRCCVCVRRNVR